MPVEAGDFHAVVVFARNLSPPRESRHNGQEADADDHVQRMKAGHKEIKTHEQLNGVLRCAAQAFQSRVEVQPGNHVFVPFVKIFGELHPEKSDPENNSGGEKSDEWAVLTFSRGVDSHGHGKAAGQQHKHHRSSEIDFESVTSRSESGVIKRSVDDVVREDTTKKQHLGGQENPHAEIA